MDAHSLMSYHSGVFIHVLADPVCSEWFSLCGRCFVGPAERSVTETDGEWIAYTASAARRPPAWSVSHPLAPDMGWR